MIRPTRTIVVFDGKGGSNRRRKIFPQYKMGRKMSYRLNRANNYLTREEEQKMMIRQLNRVVEYLECLPYIMNMENCEIDVIGYCLNTFKNNKTTIVSTDKDFDWSTRPQGCIHLQKKMYDEPKYLTSMEYTQRILLFRCLTETNQTNINSIGKKTLISYFHLWKQRKIYIGRHIQKCRNTEKSTCGSITIKRFIR